SYLGTRLCIMDKGQIIQIDTAEKIRRHPKNEFVRRLFEMGGDIDE
ncbi:MAG: ABC transporter ATP-binding protein, partial [Megasphaera micronuciformis]|nr:ABC transporter ATP-binding protein [Megasphaera micronuciformis]